jgi:nucleoside-diphosphate-sugar epimerase
VLEQLVVVVTGAGGFIGSHLVERFQSDDWKVRALVHGDPAQPRADVTYHRWTLDDPLDPSLLRGADCLIHAAFVPYDHAEASRLNVEGSRRLLQECRAAGVGRTVFLSSMSAKQEARSIYGRDKFRIQAAFDGPQETVIRPGLVLGDRGLFNSLRQFVARRRIVPLIGGGGQLIQTVHVDDLMSAVQAAVYRDLAGVVTVAEPEPTTFRALLGATAELLGVRAAFIPVPFWSAALGLRVAGALHVRLPVSLDNLEGLRGIEAEDVQGDLGRLGIEVRDYRASLRDILASGSSTMPRTTAAS